MVTIRLLANVANDNAGAVISVSDDRARRLCMTGYAERVIEEPPPKRKKD